MGIRRSRALTAIIALLFLTSGLLVSGATAASAAPAATPESPWIGTGQVSSGAGSDMCLDNSGGSNAAGNPIDLYQCNDTWDGQVWTLEYDGTLRIQNRCLDVQGGSSTDGTPVLLNTCNGSGSPGEQWEPQTDGSLLNVNSGKCLGINGAVANGSPLFIWTCDGNDTQVWHVPTADTKAASAAARLQLMWNSSEDLFDSVGGCTSVTAPGGNCWWWSANELNAMIDFIWQEQAVSGSAFPGWYAYESDISQTFNQYADGCEPSPSNGCTGLFTHDGYFDDAGWWGLTWLNAYNLIGNTDYLYMAENIFSWITANGWDSTCGGGVWQYDKAGAQKDAIANELYFELAARLNRTTQNSVYLNYANLEWNWFKSSLIVQVPENGSATVATAAQLSDPSAHLLVADHVSSTEGTTTTTSLCAPASGTQKWTYNQGVILGALHDMYKISGSASYLDPAEAIASTVETDQQSTVNQAPGPYSNPALDSVYGIGPNGTLSEPCDSSGGWPDNCAVTGSHNWFLQFKGIFIRNLACLSQDVSGTPNYQTFIEDNAATVFQDDQNTTSDFNAGADLNLFGFLWDNDGKPWPGTETAELNEATQGSALDALIANMSDSYAMC
jgi:predicted alpha-1,6-mannanase (GH76 family)